MYQQNVAHERVYKDSVQKQIPLRNIRLINNGLSFSLGSHSLDIKEFTQLCDVRSSPKVPHRTTGDIENAPVQK